MVIGRRPARAASRASSCASDAPSASPASRVSSEGRVAASSSRPASATEARRKSSPSTTPRRAPERGRVPRRHQPDADDAAAAHAVLRRPRRRGPLGRVRAPDVAASIVAAAARDDDLDGQADGSAVHRCYACDVSMHVDASLVYSEAKALVESCEAAATPAAACRRDNLAAASSGGSTRCRRAHSADET
ncbi:hypothetical protein E2562_016661 [Oryza meyeriana var. granulata]|uniref:Uncharacterized protein n=1 Tax=Oryza meyeriana var. granulata TaxID=110450 RepID=A0A6G1EL84_9ORYZ|nr:hypothetical protein E2562_016661 [Oryza meyeriana var. granulata]